MPKRIPDWEKGNDRQRIHLQKMADAINEFDEKLKKLSRFINSTTINLADSGLPLKKFTGCENGVEKSWNIPAEEA